MGNIAEIIKYEGDNSTFIWKHPCEDFNSLTQLIVHESQEAVFFMNGQALDLFGPGRYTLETQNIPEIGRRLRKTTGGETPFHCEVYFINKTVQMGIKWGTAERVRFIEPTLGIPLSIGASGEMNLMVSDSRKLLVSIVGTMNGIAWGERGLGFTKSLQNSFRPLISTAVKTHLANSIKTKNINLFEIDENLEALSEELRKNIAPGFEAYGLTIPQFYISTIDLPEDDRNFKQLRDLHTVSLQTKIAEAEATVKAAQAETQASVTAAQRRIAMEEQTTKTEVAKREAERNLEVAKRKAEQDLIEAQTKVQAAKMAGFAEAEVMQAKGYNQKDVLQADVQKAYAEGIGNMGANGGGGGVLGDLVGLGAGIAAAGQVGSQIGKIFNGFTETSMHPNFNNSNSAQVANFVENDEAGDVSPTKASEEKDCSQYVCPKCGKVLPENAKFCLECGNKIEHLGDNETICSSCGKKVAKGKFCSECGAPLVRKCSKCGAVALDGATYCTECGEKI